MMRRRYLFIYLLGLSACFIASSFARSVGSAIMGGSDANLNEFPYQISIFVLNQTACGGGIIDDRHILTAAHCVMNEDGNWYGIPLMVIAGMNDLSYPKAIGVYAEKIFVPSKYDPVHDNNVADIAVLKLQESLNVSENPELMALKLPKNEKETLARRNVTIAGFGWDWVKVYRDSLTGTISEEGGTKNPRLQFLIADEITNEKCQELYKDKRNISETQICAQAKQSIPGESSGICSGDSGGPLVYNNDTVVGIASLSPVGCSELKYPAIYTRVSSYLDFIEKARNDEDLDENMNYLKFTHEMIDQWDQILRQFVEIPVTTKFKEQDNRIH